MSIRKFLFHGILFALLIMAGMGQALAQNGTYPGLPGDHGLPENQNANENNPTQVQQVLNLNTGWNWISFYLECDPDLLSSFQEGLALNNTTAMIKSIDNTTMLQNGSWSASGLTLSNESMFMVNLSSPTMVTLMGSLADPADHPITLKSGWNWIGFPLDHPLPVTEVLSGITPNNGDMIKSMSGSLSYDGITWKGSLETLEPGIGYMYYNNGTSITLTFPSN